MLTEKPRFPIKELVLYGWLPSPLKKLLYRLKGYRIGKGVGLALGSVIIGTNVDIGPETELGFFSVVRGRTIRIGAHVQIGAASIIDTPNIDIGDGTKINEQVFIGGLQFPDSRLVIGRNCQIMQMTFVNPTRSIVIGDDSGIGGDCLLFGHTSWLSRFEGYPVDFDSIEIGNSVSIAWRVFILPGTRVGDGAVVGANSLVRGTIPPRCLAVGFPARVVAKEPDFPRRLTQADKEAILREVVDEFIERLRGDGIRCGTDGDSLIVDAKRRRGWMRRTVRQRLYVASGEPDRAAALNADVVVSLRRIPDPLRSELSRAGRVWLDLEAKERSHDSSDLGDETALQFRRHGVRFFRVKV
jgi:acetyltransferase-like isoleucine patch superfamily enzyme